MGDLKRSPMENFPRPKLFPTSNAFFVIHFTALVLSVRKLQMILTLITATSKNTISGNSYVEAIKSL